MTELTSRLGLPLLAVAQAQKELTHNEALVLADALIQPVVESVGPATVPATPAPGQCWIVGPGAPGAWAGRDGALAIWTDGGWRFVSARDGMCFWDKAESVFVQRVGGAWTAGQVRGGAVLIEGHQVVGGRQPAIDDASGGTTIDTEARTAVTEILAALRTHGLIDT